MRSSQNMRWLLAGMMGLGITATIPGVSFAADRTRTIVADDDVEIKVDKLPGVVRATIDREGDGGKLENAFFVHRDGKEFYRAIVQIKHTMRSIRVNTDGKLLSIVDRPEASKDEKFFKEYETREVARSARFAKEEAAVTATAKNPEKIDWDHLPVAVRGTFMREAAGEKQPDYIIRYRETDNVLYQTNISDGPGKVHMLQVTSDGRVFNEGEFTSKGSAMAEERRIRTLEYADLPRGIRAVVDKAAPNGRVTRSDVADRRGHKIYTVEIDAGKVDRLLTIFDDGRILSDITEKE